MIKNISFLILLILISFSCNKTDKEYRKQHLSQNLNENFDEFRSKFFSDTVFQKTRIKFPLRGMSTDHIFAEEEEKDTIGSDFMVKNHKFFWLKERWETFKSEPSEDLDFTTETKNEKNKTILKYSSKTDDIVLLLEFKKNRNKWFLEYYSFGWY